MPQTRRILYDKNGGGKRRSKKHIIPHNPIRSLGLLAFASLKGKGPKLRPRIKTPTPPRVIRPPNTHNHVVEVKSTIVNIPPIKWGGSKTRKMKGKGKTKRGIGKKVAAVAAAVISGNAPTPPPTVGLKTPPRVIHPPTPNSKSHAITVDSSLAPPPMPKWQRR